MKRQTKKQSDPSMNTGLNPQGYSEDVADQRPKSQLEQKAKKSHTKR